LSLCQRSRILLGVQNGACSTYPQQAPLWDEKAGTIDYYYWFHGTHALALAGGKEWKTWKKRLESNLSKGQLASGSWNPCGPWCSQGGTAYATAIAVMCLLTSHGRNVLMLSR
jgi:hypothetical protein